MYNSTECIIHADACDMYVYMIVCATVHEWLQECMFPCMHINEFMCMCLHSWISPPQCNTPSHAVNTGHEQEVVNSIFLDFGSREVWNLYNLNAITIVRRFSLCILHFIADVPISSIPLMTQLSMCRQQWKNCIQGDVLWNYYFNLWNVRNRPSCVLL